MVGCVFLPLQNILKTWKIAKVMNVSPPLPLSTDFNLNLMELILVLAQTIVQRDSKCRSMHGDVLIINHSRNEDLFNFAQGRGSILTNG